MNVSFAFSLFCTFVRGIRFFFLSLRLIISSLRLMTHLRKFEKTLNMRIKNLLLLIACLLGVFQNVKAQQQKHLSFTAVAQNVDGLPNKILFVDVNPDGKEGPGATELGNAIVKQGWDIVGMSEDFNFHSELTAPLGGLYYIGEHDGKVSGLYNDTDGLGILLAKRDGASLSSMTQVAWNDHNGETDQGADGLVEKGFRHYTTTLGAGFVVDVYVLHMDADDGEKDINARTSQLKQLATYIKGHNNNRPILIIGDTNCRYTRDTVKENLIDAINNAGNGMTIKDAWIELVRGGSYPTLGSGALMIDALGNRKGEVVDKIFYINIAGAPLQIEANTYELAQPSGWPSDHWPVIVNFTLTNSKGTDTAGEQKWTVDAPAATIPEVQGCEANSGKTFYFMNVGSKKYLKSGANWGTRATEGSAGMPITLQAIEGKYKLKTVGNRSMTAEATPYMDNSDQNNGWSFEKVEGSNTQYYITCGAGALYSTGEEGKVVNCATLDKSDKRFKWVLLDDEKMKEEMQKTTTEFDCTPLLKAADFDFLDFPVGENDKTGSMTNWSNSTGFANQVARDVSPATYATCAVFNGTEAKTISQTLTSMPKGNYKVSFQGFYRYRYNSSLLGGSVKDYTFDAKVQFGNGSGNLTQNTTDGIGSTGMEARFKDGTSYLTDFTTTLFSAGDVTLSVIKPAASGRKSNSSWICIDNIKIIYQGSGETAVDPTLEHRVKVAEKINETWEKVKQLNAAGQAAYDITIVLQRYNGGYVQTEADADVLCDMIDKAYEYALAAHNRWELNQAMQNGGDITKVIVNPSFETGDLTGWTIKSGTSDTNVYPNSNGTYTTAGVAGNYLFNSWNGDDASSASFVKQSIVGLKSGLYKLEAKLTSFEGRTAYLIGNNAHAGVKAEDKAKFQDATLLFLVEDGIATIGAIGASAIDGDFSYFMPTAGGFVKADAFRLAYVCDIANGRLKLAIDKANAEAAKFDKYGKAKFDISDYEKKYANKSCTGDGKAEATKVYEALAAAAKAQRTLNADMTYAITNPNFETGNWDGWTVTTSWETIVSDLDRIATLGYDGSYMFNSWNGSPDLKPIRQTVTGLPNGKYELTARMDSDGGNTMIVSGNGTEGSITAAAGTMKEVSTVFSVTNGTAEIMAGGAGSNGKLDATNGGQWFKADDFHLTFLGHNAITLNQEATTAVESGGYQKVTLKRPIPAGKWSTFVLPYTTAVPSGLIAKKFKTATTVGQSVRLAFEDATTFEAGVPYMVKPTGGEAVNLPAVENVNIDMEAPVCKMEAATVVGTYVRITIPEGAYFISNNKYYEAGAANKSNGYRAYIQINEGANVNEVVYFFDEDSATGISAAEVEDDGIVAVYSLDGRRLQAPRRGVNIVRMSDGTTRKVLVK